VKLYLKGHAYRYAVEQMLLTLFPGERPEYPTDTRGEKEDNTLVLLLSESDVWTTASAVLNRDGRTVRRRCRCRTDRLADPSELGRARQQILKLAFYRAGVVLLNREPPWGALTGVRPVKIPTRAMERGATAEQAAHTLQTVYRVSPQRVQLAMDCARASLEAKAALRPDEVSLYVGIPFCPTRCAYCSFVTADVQRTLSLLEPFVQALCREMDAAGERLRHLGLRVRTVYFGGGTPTTLSAQHLDQIMDRLARAFDLSRCTEYTVEAGRPDTITAEKLAVIQRGGADRVSVNPQSMEDQVLAAIGRAHTSADVYKAWELVRAAGIARTNMDLIAGLPADTPQGFRRSLEQVLAMGPDNITIHTLALKKGSRLKTDGASLPDGETVGEMLDGAGTALRSGGWVPSYLYRQKYMLGAFENVGWCRPGTGSLYNICMMEELHTVIALGGGGVTKLIHPETGQIRRIANPKDPTAYLRQFDSVLSGKMRLADNW